MDPKIILTNEIMNLQYIADNLKSLENSLGNSIILNEDCIDEDINNVIKICLSLSKAIEIEDSILIDYFSNKAIEILTVKKNRYIK